MESDHTGPDRNKAVVRSFVEAVNVQDWDRLDDLVAPGFVRHSAAAGHPGVRSLADLKKFLHAELTTFPDAQETLEGLVAEDDMVAARHRFRGTHRGPLGGHAATGRTMDVDYLAIYRLADGVIVEAWAEWDNLAGLSQLGLAPPGTG